MALQFDVYSNFGPWSFFFPLPGVLLVVNLDSPTYSLLRFRTGQSMAFLIDCVLFLVDHTWQGIIVPILATMCSSNVCH